MFLLARVVAGKTLCFTQYDRQSVIKMMAFAPSFLLFDYAEPATYSVRIVFGRKAGSVLINGHGLSN